MTERQIRERSAELLQAVRPGHGRPCHPCVPPCYAVVLCGRRPPLLTDLHRSLAAIAVAPGQNDNVVLPRRATARPSRTRSASTKSPGAHVPDPAVRLDPRSAASQTCSTSTRSGLRPRWPRAACATSASAKSSVTAQNCYCTGATVVFPLSSIPSLIPPASPSYPPYSDKTG